MKTRLKLLAAIRLRITCGFSLQHPLLLLRVGFSFQPQNPHFHGFHCPPHHVLPSLPWRIHVLFCY